MDKEEMTDLLLHLLTYTNKSDNFDPIEAFEFISNAFMVNGAIDADDLICAVEGQYDMITQSKRALFE